MKLGSLDMDMMGAAGPRGLLLSGQAQAVLPTTDTGWKTYAGGRLFLPAGVNLVVNPRFAVNMTDGWADSVTDIAFAANADSPVALPVGIPSCVECVYTRTADREWNADKITVDASSTYTISRYYHISALSAGGFIRLNAHVYNGGAYVRTVQGTIQAAVTTGFVRDSITVTTAGAGEDGIVISNLFGTNSSTCYLTGYLLEKTSVLTPYFDGAFADCAWSGAAHNSTSTRTASVLTYPVSANGSTFIGPSAGTIAVRVVGISALNDGLQKDWIETAGGNGLAKIYNDGSNLVTWIADSVANNTHTIATAAAAGQAQFIVLRWLGSSRMNTNFNGTDKAVNEYANTPTAFTSLKIGPLTPYAYIGPVIVSPEEKSAELVAAIQGESGATYSSLRRVWNLLSPGDVLFPLQEDSVGYLKVAGSPPFSLDGLIVFDGDSLTVGYGVDPADESYPAQLMAFLGGTWTNYQFGATGQGVESMDVDADSQIDPLLAGGHSNNILVAWLSANDLGAGKTAAEVEGFISTYCTARQAAGWTVVVGTLTPRSGAGELPDHATFESRRLEVNTWIRANWASWADALADIAANTSLGDDGDELNTTYYLNEAGVHVHMTAAGYAIAAGIFQTAIESLL